MHSIVSLFYGEPNDQLIRILGMLVTLQIYSLYYLNLNLLFEFIQFIHNNMAHHIGYDSDKSSYKTDVSNLSIHVFLSISYAHQCGRTQTSLKCISPSD